MESNYKRLGNYIQQVDVKNTDLAVNLLLGVSIDKKFIESHANTIGTDFSKYKIVKKGQFAYGPVTSRNGDKISIALLKEADSCLVSSSYIPFEITKPEELNAEYLMLLFSKPEFDRYARYNSWGSAREVFSWDDFCGSMLYIPDITEQEKIVRQYKTVTDRICLLEKLNAELEKLISTIYINNTRDYEGEKTVIKVEDYCKIFTGKKDVNKALQEGKNHFYSCSPEPLFSNESVYEGLAILVAGNGSYTGRTTIVNEAFDLYQRTYAITPFEKDNEIMYLIYAAMQTDFQEQLKSSLHGSAIPYIVYSDLAEFSFEVTTDIGKISNVIKSFVDIKLKNIEEIIELKKISKILLTKYF